MKNFLRNAIVMSLMAAAFMILPSLKAYAADGEMHCFFNRGTGELLYTINKDKEDLPATSWVYQGVVATLPSNGTAVHRLLNPVNASHLYTSLQSEIDKLVDQGWKDEGIAYFVGTSGTPIYRWNHPLTGQHLFSAENPADAENLTNLGFVKEGIAFYGTSVNPTFTYNITATAASTTAVANNSQEASAASKHYDIYIKYDGKITSGPDGRGISWNEEGATDFGNFEFIVDGNAQIVHEPYGDAYYDIQFAKAYEFCFTVPLEKQFLGKRFDFEIKCPDNATHNFKAATLLTYPDPDINFVLDNGTIKGTATAVAGIEHLEDGTTVDVADIVVFFGIRFN
ncbi:MAG: hypothetical protein IJ589_02850 [Lachnospiraceae bacterium]|nr:hypothetical protein [Lachnospiraceae bacterium]